MFWSLTTIQGVQLLTGELNPTTHFDIEWPDVNGRTWYTMNACELRFPKKQTCEPKNVPRRHLVEGRKGGSREEERLRPLTETE
jgi:hypothetical protein